MDSLQHRLGHDERQMEARGLFHFVLQAKLHAEFHHAIPRCIDRVLAAFESGIWAFQDSQLEYSRRGRIWVGSPGVKG